MLFLCTPQLLSLEKRSMNSSARVINENNIKVEGIREACNALGYHVKPDELKSHSKMSKLSDKIMANTWRKLLN